MRIPTELVLPTPVLTTDCLRQIINELTRVNEQCKDMISDIERIDNRLTSLEARVSALEAA